MLSKSNSIHKSNLLLTCTSWPLLSFPSYLWMWLTCYLSTHFQSWMLFVMWLHNVKPMPCLCIVKKSLWCCPLSEHLRTPGIQMMLHHVKDCHILCLILWINKIICLSIFLPLEQYKLNWYFAVNDVNSSTNLLQTIYQDLMNLK